MLSLTGEYALRAVIYLAQHEADWPIPGRRIAQDAGIPAKYLSKILGDLARARVLESSPGKTGGFSLHLPADKTHLLEVLTPFETFDRRRCPFGNQECSDAHPCFAHDRWREVVQTQMRFLEQTCVSDVARKAAQRPQRRRSTRRH